MCIAQPIGSIEREITFFFLLLSIDTLLFSFSFFSLLCFCCLLQMEITNAIPSNSNNITSTVMKADGKLRIEFTHIHKVPYDYELRAQPFSTRKSSQAICCYCCRFLFCSQSSHVWEKSETFARWLICSTFNLEFNYVYLLCISSAL